MVLSTWSSLGDSAGIRVRTCHVIIQLQMSVLGILRGFLANFISTASASKMSARIEVPHKCYSMVCHEAMNLFCSTVFFDISDINLNFQWRQGLNKKVIIVTRSILNSLKMTLFCLNIYIFWNQATFLLLMCLNYLAFLSVNESHPVKTSFQIEFSDKIIISKQAHIFSLFLLILLLFNILTNKLLSKLLNV